MTAPTNASVRFAGWGHVVVLDEDGSELHAPECIVVRVEGRHQCRHCSRLHLFTLNRTFPARPETWSEGVLFDSWEDAAHELREWMPGDCRTGFPTWRESGDGLHEEGPLATDRESAIRYLLAPCLV